MKEKKKQYESKVLGLMSSKQYSKDITKQSILMRKDKLRDQKVIFEGEEPENRF